MSGRQTTHDAVVVNKTFEWDSGYESESAFSRYESAAECVLKALLFCDKPRLADPISGSSGFAAEFEMQGSFDNDEQGLQQLDPKNRWFMFS